MFLRFTKQATPMTEIKPQATVLVIETATMCYSSSRSTSNSTSVILCDGEWKQHTQVNAHNSENTNTNMQTDKKTRFVNMNLISTAVNFHAKIKLNICRPSWIFSPWKDIKSCPPKKTSVRIVVYTPFYFVYISYFECKSSIYFKVYIASRFNNSIKWVYM